MTPQQLKDLCIRVAVTGFKRDNEPTPEQARAVIQLMKTASDDARRKEELIEFLRVIHETQDLSLVDQFVKETPEEVFDICRRNCEIRSHE